MKYPPVGKCIYCGATSYSDDESRALADEHIIPFALGGSHILPEASCRACETITGSTEQVALRGLLRGPRVALGLRSRKGHPDHLPMYAHLRDSVHKLDVQVEDYPTYLVLWAPAWLPLKLTGDSLPEEPRMYVTGCPLNEKAEAATKGMTPEEIMIITDDPPETVFQKSGLASPGLDIKKFYRMLAKVAHSFAVATLGLNSFKPYLLDTILGADKDDLGLYFGGPMIQPRTFHKDAFHIMSLHCEWSFDDVAYIVARIVPFAQYGGPTVYAVVGELIPNNLSPSELARARQEPLLRRF